MFSANIEAREYAMANRVCFCFKTAYALRFCTVPSKHSASRPPEAASTIKPVRRFRQVFAAQPQWGHENPARSREAGEWAAQAQ